MSKRVAFLKHATNHRKYQHMTDMLDFRRKLTDDAVNPALADRQVALVEIEKIMGGDFYAWFCNVHKLRSANRQAEYEQAIFDKYSQLMQDVPAIDDGGVFNWKVIAPNTLRVYAVAVKDFEATAKVRVAEAGLGEIDAWVSSMNARGLKSDTIRTYLRAVAAVSGLTIALPKRVQPESVLLSADEVRRLMVQVSEREHRLLLVKVFVLGAKARTMNLKDALAAHFVGGGGLEVELSAQKVSRLLKRYAKSAGLRGVNLRVWARSGKELGKRLSMDELLAVLGAGTPVDAERLHGVGRRTRRVVSVGLE